MSPATWPPSISPTRIHHSFRSPVDIPPRLICQAGRRRRIQQPCSKNRSTTSYEVYGIIKATRPNIYNIA
ncbi:hypothetical protein VTO42DRAFT_2449 [Malbranchea cinnamomea]